MRNIQVAVLGIALGISAPVFAEPIVQVTIPELTGNAVIGEKVFAAKCAECHGEAGAGNSEKGPPLIHKIYEPSHHGDMAFLVAALNGVRQHHWDFGNMMPIDGITQGEVAMIVDYIRQVQSANGIN
ncbi:cytochrome c [Thioclava sp. FR2]|uniref:cytochrome c n=1 Tax=Thioclava sp. FR2 TaxID=3445780 RepID=UPI003EC0F688